MNIQMLVLSALYILLGILPGYVFLSDKGGTSLFNGLDLPGVCGAVFPLVGLYAFFLIWAQIVIGSSMPILWRYIPWIETFHRAQGTFALLLGISHPLLLEISLGPKDFLGFSFVSPEQRVFAFLGFFQLFLLMLTALTAILMKLPFLVNRWHYIHYLNYVLFVSVFVHSWNLGSDLSASQSLRALWGFFLASGMICLAARLARRYRQALKQVRATNHGATPASNPSKTDDENLTPVTTLNELELGKPFCAMVNEKPILLCRLEDGVFALDDTCSHAGGSLCKGTLDGAIIECPRHGAKFDLRSGAVVGPPAKASQRTYLVRVKDGQVLLKL